MLESYKIDTAYYLINFLQRLSSDQRGSEAKCRPSVALFSPQICLQQFKLKKDHVSCLVKI